MLRRVWEQCAPVLGAERVVVATDDERILEHCVEYGMRYVLTPSACATGTDRLAVAANKLESDLYINVQGDEPLVDPKDIEKVICAAKEAPGEVVNAYCVIDNEDDYLRRTIPKVVMRPDGRLLYMSRAPIPGEKGGMFVKAWKQVCIYAFPPIALRDFSAHGEKSELEAIEDIEILRFVELGYEVKMVPVGMSSIAVDTPEDVRRVERVLAGRLVK